MSARPKSADASRQLTARSLRDGTSVPAGGPVCARRTRGHAIAIAIAAADRPETARSVARVTACALWGLETALVTVEVDVANGLPAFVVVGLPDAAVQEARERVRAAIRNSGYEFPLRRVTVNLAPAERRKEGTGFDLAIALGILRASGQLQSKLDVLCFGELALDGALRPVRGAMPRVRHAAARGIRAVVVATDNAGEAAACGVAAYGFGSLRDVVDHLDGRVRVPPCAVPPRAGEPRHEVDLADIAGQETPKRALEIAAAGGHNLLFVGPPGTGKTMLARALPSILPPLDDEEAIAASAIHSVAGLADPRHPILTARPFRAPHHTASHLALVGGGSPPRPGEVSLAHPSLAPCTMTAWLQPSRTRARASAPRSTAGSRMIAPKRRSAWRDRSSTAAPWPNGGGGMSPISISTTTCRRTAVLRDPRTRACSTTSARSASTPWSSTTSIVCIGLRAS